MSGPDISNKIIRHGIRMAFVDGLVQVLNEGLGVTWTGIADRRVEADDEETYDGTRQPSPIWTARTTATPDETP
jgi:hypothetical protein